MATYPDNELDPEVPHAPSTPPPPPINPPPLPPAAASEDTGIAKPPLPADEAFARFQQAQPAPAPKVEPEPVAPPEPKLPPKPAGVDPFDTTTPVTPEKGREVDNFLSQQGVLGDPQATDRLAGAYDRQQASEARKAEADAEKAARDAETERKKAATTAVRQMAEAGVETKIADDGTTVPVTDEKTGRPVYKQEFTGGPRFDDATKSWVKDWRNADGSTSPVDMLDNGQIKTDRATGEMFFKEHGKRVVVGKNEQFLRQQAIGQELAGSIRDTKEKQLQIDDLKLNRMTPLLADYTKGKNALKTAEEEFAKFTRLSQSSPTWIKNPANARALEAATAERDRVTKEFAPVREQYEGAKANIDKLEREILTTQQRQLALYREKDTIAAAKVRPQFAAPAAPAANETPDQVAERQRHGIGGTEWQVPDLKTEAEKLDAVMKEHAARVKAAGGNTSTLANLGELDAQKLGAVAEARATGQAEVDRQTARVSALKRFDTVSANLEKEATATEAQRAQIVTNVRAQQKALVTAIRAGQANASQYDALTASATKAVAGLDAKLATLRGRQTNERKALKAGLDGQQGAAFPESLIARDGARASVDPDAIALRAAGRSAFLHQDERQSRLDVLEEARRNKITHVGDQPIADAIKETRAEKQVTLDDVLNPVEAQNLRRGIFGLTDGTLGTELGRKYSLGTEQGVDADGTKFVAPKLEYAGDSLPKGDFQTGQTMAQPVPTPADAAKDWFQNLVANPAIRTDFPKGPQRGVMNGVPVPENWKTMAPDQKRAWISAQDDAAKARQAEREADRRSVIEKVRSLGSAVIGGADNAAAGVFLQAPAVGLRFGAGALHAAGTLVTGGGFEKARQELFSARPAAAEWALNYADTVNQFWSDAVDEEDRGTMAEQIAQGVGSALAFSAAGGAAGTFAKAVGATTAAEIRAAQTVTAASVGAATNGAQAYTEALDRGDTDAEAFARFAVGAGLGTSEAFGLGNILTKLDRFSGVSLKKFLLGMGKEGLEEGAQQAFQTAGMDVFDALNGQKNGIDLKTVDGWKKLLGNAYDQGKVAALTGLVYSAGMGGIVQMDDRLRNNRAQRAFDTLDAKHTELSEAVRSPEGLAAFNAKQAADGRKPISMATAIDLAKMVATARAAKATGMLLDDDERAHGIAKALDGKVDAAKLTAEIRNRPELTPTLIEIGRQAGPALLTPEVRTALQTEQGGKAFASPRGTAERRLVAGRLVVDTHLRGVLEGKTVPAAVGQSLEDMGLLVRRELPPLADGTPQSQWVVSAPGLQLMPGDVRAAVQKAPENFAVSTADTGAPNRVGADLEDAGNALLSAALAKKTAPVVTPAPLKAGTNEGDFEQKVTEGTKGEAGQTREQANASSSSAKETSGLQDTTPVVSSEVAGGVTQASTSADAAPEEATHRVTLETAPDKAGFSRRRSVEVAAESDEAAGRKAAQQAGAEWQATKISKINPKNAPASAYKEGDGSDGTDVRESAGSSGRSGDAVAGSGTSGGTSGAGESAAGAEDRRAVRESNRESSNSKGNGAGAGAAVGDGDPGVSDSGAGASAETPGGAGNGESGAGGGQSAGGVDESLAGTGSAADAKGRRDNAGGGVAGVRVALSRAQESLDRINSGLGLIGARAVTIQTHQEKKTPGAWPTHKGGIRLALNPEHAADLVDRLDALSPGLGGKWLDLTLSEELTHIAQLLSEREKWEKAGKRGTFTEFSSRTRAARLRMASSLLDRMAARNPEEARTFARVILSALDTYFEQAPDATRQGELVSLRDRVRAALRGGDMVETAKALLAELIASKEDGVIPHWMFEAEVTRQLVQAMRQGKITEQAGARGLIKQFSDFLRDIVTKLKAMAQTPEIKAALRRIHEILDLAEGRDVTMTPGPEPDGGLPVLNGKAATAFALPAEQLRDFLRGEHLNQPKGAKRMAEDDLIALSKHFDRIGDTRRGAIVTGELARRAAEDQAAQTREGQRAQSYELLDAIERLGGLPTADAMRGELAQLRELPRAKRPGLFRKDGPSLDRIASDLRDYGFSFESPDDLLRALTDRLQPEGGEQYGDRIGAADLAAANPTSSPEIHRLLVKQRNGGLSRAEQARLDDLERAAGQGNLFDDGALGRAPAQDLVLESQQERAAVLERLEQSSLFAGNPLNLQLGLELDDMTNGGQMGLPLYEKSEAVRKQVLETLQELGPPSALPAVEEPSAVPKNEQGLVDFGRKMNGARKDRVSSAAREISDDDISSLPFSKIWPKSEVDEIEDVDTASLAYVIRDSIPHKPQNGYKLKSWVEKVKAVRGLMRTAEELGADAVLDRMNRPVGGLNDLANKIRLLREVPRADWERIGEVHNYPDAYSYARNADGSSGEKVPSPFAAAQVDGRRLRSTSLEGLTVVVREALGEGAPAPSKMKFEVRGSDARGYRINKKGDPLYRALKAFPTAREALDFVRSNPADLVAEWEKVKERENVKERDLRGAENRPRVGGDHRLGRDATPEMFTGAFGFRGVEFGNWVSQGGNAKERQGMLNQAYDALLDLADILKVPPKALSLNGTMGLAFGSRGHGWASAHYEPGNIVINLTKTRGAGTLAHEWFHGLDHYFGMARNDGESVKVRNFEGQNAFRDANFLTHAAGEQYVNRSTGQRISASAFNRMVATGRMRDREEWARVEGVRPEVEAAFSDLVKTLAESPMAKRAAKIDKGKSEGYWSRTLEIAARSFENYVIDRMQKLGYHNDYLANVVTADKFAREPELYPYHLEGEMKPVAEAFENLFSTLQTKETPQGVALFAADPLKQVAGDLESAPEEPIGQTSRAADAKALTPEQRKLVGPQIERATRMAAGYSVPGMEAADVRQEAVAAVVRAATVFDPARGVPFENFASVVVRNHLADVWRRGVVGRTEPFADGTGEMVPASNAPAGRADDAAETARVLREVVGELPARLQTIVNGREAGRTLEDIGREIGLAPSSVANGEKVAMGLLKAKLKKRGFTGLAEDGVLMARDPLRLQPTWDELLDETVAVPSWARESAREQAEGVIEGSEAESDGVANKFRLIEEFPALMEKAEKAALEEEKAAANTDTARTALRKFYDVAIRGQIDAMDSLVPGTSKVVLEGELDANLMAGAMRRWKDALQGQFREAFGYPSWWRDDIQRLRLKNFGEELLPAASFLNATEGATDENGVNSFVFTDFWQRAGEMSPGEAKHFKRRVGKEFLHTDGDTYRIGEMQHLYRGKIVTPERAAELRKQKKTVQVFHQLERWVPASEQHQIHRRFHARYPEAGQFLDMFIDPRRASDRVVSPNGYELPAFNRHSLYDYYGDTPMGLVDKIPGYTPDVVRSRGVAGFLANALRIDSRSPGRNYKTGQARESGLTRPALDGFSIRAAQAHMETSRRNSTAALLKHVMRETPANGAPEGWVALDKQAINPLVRMYNEWTQREGGGTKLMEEITANTTSQISESNRKLMESLFGTPAAFNPQQMVPKMVLKRIQRDFVNTQVNNRFVQGVIDWVRGSVSGVLFDLQTLATNIESNYVFTTLLAFQRTAAAAAWAADGIKNELQGHGDEATRSQREATIAVREAGNLVKSFMPFFFNPTVRERLDRIMPMEAFEDSNALKIAMGSAADKSVKELISELNFAAAGLRAVGYGNVDPRAKQKIVAASLLARASVAADEAGITGKERRAWIQNEAENSSAEDRLAAMYAARLFLMDYANVPSWMDSRGKSPWHALGISMAFPFIKYPYCYGRQAKRLLFDSAKTALPGNVHAPQWLGGFEVTRGAISTKEERVNSAANLVALTMLMGLYWLLRHPWDPNDHGEVLGRDYDDNGKKMDPKYRTGSRVRAARSSIFGMAINTAARLFGARAEDMDGQDNWVRLRTVPYATPAMFLGGAFDYISKRLHGENAAAVNVSDGAWNMIEDYMSVGTGTTMGLTMLGFRSEYDQDKQFPFLMARGGMDLLTARLLPPRAIRDIASLFDPVQTRQNANANLGYSAGAIPGMIERLPFLNSLLPPSGGVQSGADPDSEATLAARTKLAAMGLEDRAYREYIDKDGRLRAAYVRPELIWKKPAWAIGVRQTGFNVKPIDSAAYENAARGVSVSPK